MISKSPSGHETAIPASPRRFEASCRQATSQPAYTELLVTHQIATCNSAWSIATAYNQRLTRSIMMPCSCTQGRIDVTVLSRLCGTVQNAADLILHLSKKDQRLFTRALPSQSSASCCIACILTARSILSSIPAEVQNQSPNL